MAFGDDAQIPQLGTHNGQPTLQALNENLKRVWEELRVLQGITGESEIRSSLTVRGGVVAEGGLNTPSITTSAGTITPSIISADGSLPTTFLGVPQYGLVLTDAIGVRRDLAYPGILSGMVRDEFLGTGTSSGLIGDLGWALTGSLSAVAETGHPGVVELATGGGPASATLALNPIFGNTFSYLGCLLKPSSTSNCRFSFGVQRVVGGIGGRGTYFQYDSAASANWQTFTSDGTSSTTYTTNIPMVAGNWFLLEIVATTTSADFYINRVKTTRHVDNLEAAVTSPCIAVQTTDAVGKTVRVDAFAWVDQLAVTKKWT